MRASSNASIRWRSIRAICACVSVAFIAPSDPSDAATSEAPEQHIKAAYLFNFARFVNWPDEDSKDVISFCVLGSKSIASYLEKEVKNRIIRGQSLAVRQVTADKEDSGCNVLFISETKRDEIPRILAWAPSASVLTVGETMGFVRLGGVIEFVMQGQSLLFIINRTAASDATLTVNSQLLSLATEIVETEPR